MAIKAQVLAYFIAEFTNTQDEEESPKRIWTIQTDRFATKKAGGVGVLLISPEGEILKYTIRLQFLVTNNKAEYEALLIGLRLAKALEAKVLIVQADSQLVIGQVRGDYKAKEERMPKYLKIVQQLLPHFDNVDFQWILRAKNDEANFLARLASFDNHYISHELCMERREQPSTEGEQVLTMQRQESWITPIIGFLKEGQLPKDKIEARKIQIRTAHFVIINDVLYK